MAELEVVKHTKNALELVANDKYKHGTSLRDC